MTDTLKFQFDRTVSMTDVADSIEVAMIAAEGLFGTAVRLGVQVAVDPRRRACTISDASDTGGAVARVFTRLLEQSCGADAFEVRRAPGRTFAGAA